VPETSIRAEGLGKRFRIGTREPYRTLREALAHAVAAPFRRGGAGSAAEAPDAPDSIWALRDVSFEVRRGEVVGIVGPNGAGKSTLLRILARITEPTRGRAEIRGRVGSLLEVGTGFHPELTGRENVYLNGAILGMRRAEIRARFDAIVDFAGVETFLDTPVKRYSSGMRVRLAFAVAAHLEPEILIVDEVLAVGDAAFQQRCLGKMSDVAGEGRTVLFVSHHMPSVSALCTRALLLDGGRVCADGPVERVIDAYLARVRGRAEAPVAERADRAGTGRLRFTAVEVGGAEPGAAPRTGAPLRIAVRYRGKSPEPLRGVRLALLVTDGRGHRVCAFDTRFLDADFAELPPAGEIACTVPRLPLAAGRYELGLWAEARGEVADHVEAAASFPVEPGDFFGTGRATDRTKHGPVLVDHAFRFAETEGTDGG